MMNVRFKILPTTSPSDFDAHFSITKLNALPTANRNEGKTRSVGVNPCQCAWWSGENVVSPLPGVFTMIMKQIVMPRKTSSEVKRSFNDMERHLGFIVIYLFFRWA